MSPRPILKRSGSYASPAEQAHYHHRHHHHHNQPQSVHFPPSPSLTRVFSAHSSQAYDRSPIVVSPNSCALPERGCPGRTYEVGDNPAPLSSPVRRGYGGGDLHPRAFAFASSSSSSSSWKYAEDDDNLRTPTRTGPTLPPPLIPDLSSESDESDGFISPPPESAYTYETYHVHGLAVPAPKGSTSYIPSDIFYGPSSPTAQAALAFLPYPPSPPMGPTSSHYYPAREEDTQLHKSRRRRDERERKHESSDVPDRIRSREGSSPTKKRSSSSTRQASYRSLCSSLSSMSVEDDGCLGGF
ncbi:hypothetical protein BDQ12DRAFT_242165 [Crucibulum laeve]|uniref:Uncharacterized protein n=1 Tax=Crucibulum laeve TaxID=68775 RepID=A0A5C3LVA0_9AGAR|nr:hypothetical protein BDQ12DRAFT_242165 [Crucibulum laeve]